MALTVGYKILPEMDRPPDLLRYASLAERLGFETLWASDHFHPWTDSRSAAGFAWTLVASAAERTKRARVGTGVTAPILRYHPAVVAQAFATLAATYPGRIFLGLGAGEALNESPLGYPWPSPRARVEMLEEAIRVITMLWRGGFRNFQGRHYRLRGARLYTLPPEPPKIYVAAGGPRVAELAGRLADGLVILPRPHRGPKLLRAFEEGARRAGRDPAGLERIGELLVSYHPDYDEAVRSCRPLAGTMLPQVFAEDLSDPRQIEALGEQVPDRVLEERMIIASTPEEHLKRVRSILGMGLNHVYFVSLSPDEEDFLRAYGQRVLPHLREAPA